MATRFIALAAGAAAIGVGLIGYRWYRDWRQYRDILETAEREVVEALSEEGDLLADHLIETSDEVLNGLTLVKPKTIRRKNRTPFRKYLIRQAKAKFGLVSDNNANRLVVRKFMVDIAKEHGLVARHINDNVDFAVEMMFVPTQSDLVARAVNATTTKAKNVRLMSLLGGPRAQKSIA